MFVPAKSADAVLAAAQLGIQGCGGAIGEVTRECLVTL